ncbi:MAG: glycosyltransferase family 4 protein [Flavobacteriaceae bacterium]|nr:glycosyltransferase family 4 protein [Flavobacteriaceae bacterium]
MKKILYIGNNLTQKLKYNSTLTTLSNLLVNEGFEVIISSNKTKKIVRLIAMCWSVIVNRKIVDYILIDTFSTTNFYYAYCTSQLARLFKIPYIPILHGGNLPNRLQKSRRLSRRLFNNSKINVAPSNYLKNAFEKESYKTILIPNTIEINQYKFNERKVFKPTILWVRAFDETYNPQMAVYVLNELKKDFSEAKLCMIGPQKDETLELTKELIKSLDLDDSVEITGVLPKEEWHQKSKEFDIFINTTNFDNTPVSLIEVMALGLPIVSTNVGGIPFLINDGIDGVLVDKNNVNRMVNAIKNYIIYPTNTYQISKNARLKVEKFDWNNIRNQWLEVLS